MGRITAVTSDVVHWTGWKGVSELKTGAEIAAECLDAYGVRHVFGLPGSGNIELLDAAAARGIDFLSVRHESAAAFAADGYARATRKMGVCTASRSGASANLSIGIQNAYQESIPVCALLGQVESSVRHLGTFEEMELVDVYSSFTKYIVEVTSAGRVGETVGRALELCVSGRPGPTAVALPIDVQKEKTEASVPAPFTAALPVAEGDAIRRAAELLLAAKFPLILAGGGVQWSGAQGELLRLAETLTLPVVATWQRNDVFPNDHPLYLGMAGGGAVPVTYDALKRADVILAVGCKFSRATTAGFTAVPRYAKIVHIDVEPSVIGKIYPAAVGILADAAEALRAISKAVERTGGPIGTVKREKKTSDLHERFLSETAIPEDVKTGSSVHPASVPAAMREALSPDTLVVLDSGAFAFWVLRHYPFTRPQTIIAPSGGAMGFGWPASLGARLALPDKPILCVVGDGGFAMTMAEVETAARYGLDVTCVVMNDSAYGNVLAKQDRLYGGRRLGTELGAVDFAAAADALGGRGWSVEKSEDLVPALCEALRHRGPAVVDVAVNGLHIGK